MLLLSNWHSLVSSKRVSVERFLDLTCLWPFLWVIVLNDDWCGRVYPIVIANIPFQVGLIYRNKLDEHKAVSKPGSSILSCPPLELLLELLLWWLLMKAFGLEIWMKWIHSFPKLILVRMAFQTNRKTYWTTRPFTSLENFSFIIF